MTRPTEGSVARVLAGAVDGAVRHRSVVFALVAAVTLLLAAGLPKLEYRTEIMEWMPTDDENVQAFNDLLDELEGISNMEFVYLELDPSKTGVTNVTDEEAVRAQHEVFRYVQDRVPAVKHVFGLPQWVMLVNYANHGNDPDAFAMPPETPEGEMQYRAAWETAWRTSADTIQLSISDDWKGAWIGLVFEGDPLSGDSRRVGADIRDALIEYQNDPSVERDIFNDRYMHPYGLASGLDHIDDTMQRDVELLATFALAFIAASLWVAFRNVRLVLLALTTLGVGVTWTYGLMGWLGIELSIVNVAIVPLVLGTGIDYAIHVLNRYQEARRAEDDAEGSASGRRPPDGRSAAARVAVPIAFATVTTTAGLLATATTASEGMTNLALLATFSLLSIFVLSLTLLPAGLAALGKHAEGEFRPVRALGRVAERLGRRPMLVIAVLALFTGAAAYNAQNAYILIDMVEGNFPDEDPFVVSGRRLQEQVKASSVEFVILRGDVTDPEALDYVRELERHLFNSSLVARRANVQSMVSVLGLYESLKNGTAGAVPVLGPGMILDPESPPDGRSQAPDDRATIERDLREMHENPAWAPIVKLITSQEQDLAVIVVAADAADTSYEGAKGIWDELHRILDASEHARPDDVDAHVYGYRTIPYHFASFSLDQLKTLFVTSLAVSAILMLLLTRSPRAAIAFVVPLVVSSVWWYGTLPSLDLYVSVFLLFPMIFITSIGSDYAAHLIWELHHGTPVNEVFRTVGKAVLVSAVTDGGAFGLFSLMYLESARTIMLATSVAILVSAAATLSLIPVFYARRGKRRTRAPAGGPVATLDVDADAT